MSKIDIVANTTQHSSFQENCKMSAVTALILQATALQLLNFLGEWITFVESDDEACPATIAAGEMEKY